MQIRKILTVLVVGFAVSIPFCAFSQSSSINAFSPYTFTGLGEFSTPGPAFIRSMGGAGIAFRSPWMLNYMNPASNSAAGQKSFILNFGLEGGNYYLKSADKKSSHNTFNVRDVSLRFPLAKGVGVGVSVTPLSNVGYRVEESKLNDQFDQEKRTYLGEGGVSQVKVAVGAELFKGFSLGAEMAYYLGTINRYNNTEIIPIMTEGPYNPLTITQTEHVSKIFANFGLQYDIIAKKEQMLTVGATYQLGGGLNSKINRYIPANNIYQDVVFDTTYRSDYALPNVISVGVYYHREKLSFGADYSLQQWKGLNKSEESDKVEYTNSNTFKIGMGYTPNRRDVRRFYNRWTYRAGFRYSTHYLKLNGQQLNDKAITLGFGVPVKMSGLSNINFGMEMGSFGRSDFGLIKQNYVKFSIGLSLFGEDYWFVKPKYD